MLLYQLRLLLVDLCLLEELGPRPQDLVHGLHNGGNGRGRDKGVALHVALIWLLPPVLPLVVL